MKKISEMKLLFTGANGNKAFGFRMQSCLSKEKCEESGYQYEFNLNLFTLNGYSDSLLKELGFNEEDIYLIRNNGVHK